MATSEQERESQRERDSEKEQPGLGRGAALTAAGAAAATGAAALAAQRMLSKRAKTGSRRRRDEEGNSGPGPLASAAGRGWDAARDALGPLVENAAAAAGRYVAQHAPDDVRDRIVPRFIDAFTDASG